jgi:transposase
MNELLKDLDSELIYQSHTKTDKYIIIKASSEKESAICPYCRTESSKVHSRYTRKLKDLPIFGRKTFIELEIQKFFCNNPECEHKTFAERFDFFDVNSAMTKRLKAEVLRVSLTQSSVSASKYLRASVADIGKSTICELLKKSGGNLGQE